MNASASKSTCGVVREIVQRRLLADDPFVLVDVGCSGGIAVHWRAFEPALRAYGFDPLVRECERLRGLERNPQVRYFDSFVGWDGYRDLFPEGVETDPMLGWSNQPFPRTSAARAQNAQAESFVQAVFNYGNADLKYTENRTSLDAFFAGDLGAKVDFVKVDTDGHDYEVLCGARGMLESHQVLGLLVEAQFHGVIHPHANLFANIDRLLRESGFSLFDLELYRYTRAVLPGHFTHSIAAQTREGQVLWGDALYLRDLGAPGYEERWQPSLSATKLLKLVCLFEMFGLPDCAAEVLCGKREALAPVVNVDGLLDKFTGEIHPRVPSFVQVNRRFDEAPNWFYPRSIKERLRRALPHRLRRTLAAGWRRLRH